LIDRVDPKTMPQRIGSITADREFASTRHSDQIPSVDAGNLSVPIFRNVSLETNTIQEATRVAMQSIHAVVR
jgi:hypothetical protein